MRNESSTLRYQPRHRKSQPSNSSAELSSTDSSSFGNFGSSQEPGRWDVTFAKVVMVYQGPETGSMGLAVTIRASNDMANMIIYKQKTQVITSLRLLPHGFNVHMRDSYVQFYDDSRAFWSLRFVNEQDEQLFVHIMTENHLPLEVHRDGSTGGGPAEHKGHCCDHKEPMKCACGKYIGPRLPSQASKKTYTVDPQPQPKPRLRSMATSMDKAEIGEDAKPKPTYMEALRAHFMQMAPMPQAIRDSIPDDVIVTPMPRPIGTTENPSDDPPQPQMALAHSSVSLLNKFVDQQRVKGLDKKVECVLNYMRKMNMGQGKGLPDEGTKPKLTTKNDATTTTSTMSEDPEDKLIDLELAVLNLKKENRALAKSLKKREDELHEFQSSSATLLERLLEKNQDLLERNCLLVDTITGTITRKAKARNNNTEQPPASTPGLSCDNCDRSAKEIEFLKGHISAMEQARRESDL